MSTRKREADSRPRSSKPARRLEASRIRSEVRSRLPGTGSPRRIEAPPSGGALAVRGRPAALRLPRAASRPQVQHLLLGLQKRRGNRYVQGLLAVQRRAEGEREVAPDVETAIERRRGGGQALERGVRQRVEPIFDTSFSAVRTHTDTGADRLNQRLNARAFTTGNDIFFRHGELNASTASGMELLAHELAHVVQQTGGAVRRRMTLSQPGDPAEREAEAVAKEVVRVDQRRQSAGLVRRQEEEKEEEPLGARLSRQEEEKEEEPLGARLSRQEEEKEEEPPGAKLSRQEEEKEEEPPGAKLSRQEEEEEEEPLGAKVSRQEEEKEEEPPGAKVSASGRDPAAVLAELGPGRPLDARARGRMESAFGDSFSGVRVHTDPRAAAVADRLHAHAFTVGQDVGFAAGRYRPGTVVGDALLAHELAHTLQQRGARAAVETLDTGTIGEGALEADANRSALDAVRSLWGKAVGRAGEVARSALPRLRSGLRVSLGDCNGGKQQAAAPTATIGEVNAPNTPAGVKRIPPRVDTEVDVKVSGASAAAPVTLAIAGGSAANGKATINGAATHTLTKSAKIKLKGSSQTSKTSPGKPGKLKLVAKHGSTLLAASNGFSVAAYPKEVGFNFNAILSPLVYNGLKYWGAKYDLTWKSDSNTPGDCDKTKTSENIVVKTAEGLWAGSSTTTSGFWPTTAYPPDHHATGGVANAAAMKKKIDASNIKISKYVAHQFHRFSCERSGVAEDKKKGPKVPTSGFKITRTVSKSGGKYYIHVKKEGFANHGVAAGPVDDTSVKDAEVKD